MNIVLVMSGGIGARFGAVVPKQYNLIAGKPVIDYVLDAVEASKKTDRTVIVMDPKWIDFSLRIRDGNYDIASNGTTRFESMFNGLKLIKEKYVCEKIVIVDAVAPFLYSDLIDDYFEKLDFYNVVITSQKITGGLTDIYDNNLDREQYIITQSPEAFRFIELWDNFDLTFQFQETAGMLPKGIKRYYNYNFANNLKLTYDFELHYAESVLRDKGIVNIDNTKAYFNKNILITDGIKSFLLRNEKELTMQWIDLVYSSLPRLLFSWRITSFFPNQLSRYGLVLEAKSQKYGDVIIKFIPEFVGRFQRELEAMEILPDTYMCQLIDVERSCNCMLLERITPAHYGCFEERVKLISFFDHVVRDAVPYDKKIKLNYIPYYLDELKEKLANAEMMPYCRKEIELELINAVRLFEEEFSDAKLYIMHGDLHENNILDNGKRFYGIDPNGMLGPIELEFVRFIRNDVRNHSSYGFEKRFVLLLHTFERFVDISRLVDMFIIDMAFCTYNSTFENDSPEETYVDLELIQIAKKWNRLYHNNRM